MRSCVATFCSVSTEVARHDRSKCITGPARPGAPAGSAPPAALCRDACGAIAASIALGLLGEIVVARGQQPADASTAAASQLATNGCSGSHSRPIASAPRRRAIEEAAAAARLHIARIA